MIDVTNKIKVVLFCNVSHHTFLVLIFAVTKNDKSLFALTKIRPEICYMAVSRRSRPASGGEPAPNKIT